MHQKSINVHWRDQYVHRGDLVNIICKGFQNAFGQCPSSQTHQEINLLWVKKEIPVMGNSPSWKIGKKGYKKSVIFTGGRELAHEVKWGAGLWCSVQAQTVWEGREQWDCRTHQQHKINLGRQTKCDCEELPNVVVGLSAWTRKLSGDIWLQWKVTCMGDKTVSPLHAEHGEGTLELQHLLPAKKKINHLDPPWWQENKGSDESHHERNAKQNTQLFVCCFIN